MSKTTPYVAVARKYRPKTFAAVCHQEAIVTTLKNALLSERVAQSYLFCGTRGTGKTTLARLLAKALNCENLSSDGEPCNQCRSCNEINSGNSLDVIEIDGASNRGIDDIRQINETVGYVPSSSKWKIYIIDEVHMLTKEAFNALLKTLEEPPPRVKFFFATTEPHKVLPTITSRCQRFDLGRIANHAIEKKLKSIAEDLGVEVEENALSLIAELGDGSMRDAESLFDQITCFQAGKITHASIIETLGLTNRELFFQLDTAVDKQNLAFAFELSQTVFDSGKDLKHFLDHLISHYRLILRLHLGQHALLGALPADERAGYEKALTIYTHHHCLDILDYLVSWLQQIPSSPFKRIDLEMISLFILRIKKRIPLDSLIARLSELENAQPSEKAPEPAPVVEKTPEPEPVQQPAPVVESTPDPQPIVEKTPEPAPVVEKAPVQEAPEPAPVAEKAPILESPPAQPIANEEPTTPHDTLIRFAAVELNGTVKN